MKESPARAFRVLNATSVETPFGTRFIELVCGDIVQATDPLVAFSSHARSGAYLTGQVVDAIEDHFRVDLGRVTAAPVVTPGESFGTWEVQLPDPDRRWLLVRLMGASSVAGNEEEMYAYAVWTLFGSIAALELRGTADQFESLAMTHLAGRRGFSIEMQTKVLIRAASQWLRTSRHMNTIRIYVGVSPDESTVEHWREALNTTLGRVPISLAGQTIVVGLRDELVARLRNAGALTHPELDGTRKDLTTELMRERLTLATIAIHGRKFCEAITAIMLQAEKKKYDRAKFDDNVELLASSNVIAPWSKAYFHTLRQLGNESVHYRKSDVLGVPGHVSEADIVALLAALVRVATIFDEWHARRAPKASNARPRG